MSTSEDLCLSAEADDWFVFGEGKLWGRRQKRSKRKRKYRMKKRRDELFRQSELHKELDLLEAKIGSVSERLKQLVLSSSSIETIYYESKTYGKSGRIDYIADLLLNPLYNSKKYLNPAKKRNVSACYTPHQSIPAPQPSKTESLKFSANTSARRHGSFSPASVKALTMRSN